MTYKIMALRKLSRQGLPLREWRAAEFQMDTNVAW